MEVPSLVGRVRTCGHLHHNARSKDWGVRRTICIVVGRKQPDLREISWGVVLSLNTSQAVSNHVIRARKTPWSKTTASTFEKVCLGMSWSRILHPESGSHCAFEV